MNGSTWGYEFLKHSRHEDDNGNDKRDRDRNSPGRWYKIDLAKNKPVREGLDDKMMPLLPFDLAIRPKTHGITAKIVADLPEFGSPRFRHQAWYRCFDSHEVHCRDARTWYWQKEASSRQILLKHIPFKDATGCRKAGLPLMSARRIFYTL